MTPERELDVKVARLLGWTSIRELPYGELMGYHTGGAFGVWTSVPRYTIDLEAALALPIKSDMQYDIIAWGDGGKYVALYDSDFFPYREEVQDGMPLAERVVRAWLAWKESQNG